MMKSVRSLRASLILAAALASSSAPALAAPIPVAELSRYLNSLDMVQASFVQINSDGSKSSGLLSINRPGKARFEYAPPEKTVVIAGNGSVAIFDGKSNQPPEQYPLKRTPLSIVLARNVNLANAKMVVGQREVAGATRIMAQDPDNPEYGTIELVFTPNPTTLRAWIITDQAGNTTEVDLGPLQPVDGFAANLFDISAEAQRRDR